MSILNSMRFTVVLGCLTAGLLTAQQLEKKGGKWAGQIQKTIAVSENARLTMNGIEGDVSIMGWDKNEIVIHAAYQMDIFSKSEAESALNRLKQCIAGSDNEVVIAGAQCQRSWMSLDFEVQVPYDCEVSIDLECGDVQVEAMQAALQCKTGAGDVECRSIDGETRIISGAGDINLEAMTKAVYVKSGGGDVEGQDFAGLVQVRTGGGEVGLSQVKGALDIQTGGGEVDVLQCDGPVLIQTGGGEVAVVSCSQDVDIQTGGGEIEARDVGGALRLKTGGGEVLVHGVRGNVTARTGGGDVVLNDVHAGVRAVSGGGTIDVSYALKDIDESHPVDIVTGSGDIVLHIPEYFKATVSAQIQSASFWGDYEINTDFPLVIKTQKENGVEIFRASGDLNGGGSLVLLKTQNGDIHILKK